MTRKTLGSYRVPFAARQGGQGWLGWACCGPDDVSSARHKPDILQPGKVKHERGNSLNGKKQASKSGIRDNRTHGRRRFAEETHTTCTKGRQVAQNVSGTPKGMEGCERISLMYNVSDIQEPPSKKGRTHRKVDESSYLGLPPQRFVANPD